MWLAYAAVLIGAVPVCAAVVNFETAPVHPIALGPDGNTLAVCNLADGRIELFDVTSDVPESRGDVPVGIDPVSVRFRTPNELWVVNHISSSISIVDITKRRVVATLKTLSGPADLIFAGSPLRAFVSCAKENTVQVFDPVTRTVLTNVVIDGDRPKAMAASPDGRYVYAAVFESGNASTILVGEVDDEGVVSALQDPRGPYGGQMPPPNVGTNLVPPLYEEVDPRYYTLHQPDSLIVKKNAAGRWMDDNNGDWTEFISGTNSTMHNRAGLFGRPMGWDMPDRDLAIIDTESMAVRYATGLMNICMDVAVNPASGKIAVIGTDATNERRFEPNLRGTFLRVSMALMDPVTLAKTIVDLNPHLDYSTSSVPVSVRERSIGDPRGIMWNAAGTRGYVTGMGSRNMIVIDPAAARITSQPVELGDGPAGMALDEGRQRLYILNRFDATVSVVDTITLNVLTNVSFYDPTPEVMRAGRKHLYDTRRNSGLGHLSCASCHVDARFDRLAWDLSDPTAPTYFPDGPDSGLFHPLKGPLVTQTLQDIIGHEPLHWRGDRPGIESFNPTFTALLGRDTRLTTNEMREFKEFLATITFPPNRFRNFDNSLPTNVPLAGLFGVDTNSGMPDLTPLPNGDARNGLDRFRGIGGCAKCHQSPAGRGIDGDEELTLRENVRPFKVAQLRSVPDKLGMDRLGTSSRAGFGFRFDGRDDTLTRFLVDLFEIKDNQEIADLTAFLFAFSGFGDERLRFSLFGPSKDVPAAIGRQLTLATLGSHEMVAAMVSLASAPSNRVDLVARGFAAGLNRGWVYDRYIGRFQSDRNNEDISLEELLAIAAADCELTFTVVPLGSGRRIGVDRDADDYFDRTEIELGFNPADPFSRGGNSSPRLAPIPNIAVHPEMQISIPLMASDPDVPGQTLAFSFIGDVPAGAALNPTTGLFTWTPTAGQSDRTYRITTRVVDNGSPSMNQAQWFDVSVVTLRVISTAQTVPGVRVVISTSVPGETYQLQFKNRLEDSAWTTTGLPSRTAPAAHFWDSVGNVPQRFYRVVRQE